MVEDVDRAGGDAAFGTIGVSRPDTAPQSRFRIALMGDFSGRAARGICETGADLAKRRPIKLDINTLDSVIAGFATTLVLPIGKKGAGIEVTLNEIDDLHPDELFEKVEMFEALVSLRRRLGSGATAKSAAAELREWGKEHGRKVAPPSRRSAGNAVPAGRKLSEFGKLIGGNLRPRAEASSADDLIARIVGPYITRVADEDMTAMQAAVDEALSGAMRLLLHHPEFQSIEAQWRMLDLIARSIETDAKLDIVLYDISAEELAADLSAQDDLAESGFFELLVESTPDGRGPFSAICGLYTFEETPPHAALLGRIAKVAAHVNAPFFASIGTGYLDTKIEDRHPLVAASWDALRALPEAGFVGLVTPRFLLRRPYGAKSDPVYEFEFEEFTPQDGLSGMLWSSPVALVAILLARSWRKSGASMGLGSVMSLGGLPFYYVKDQYGDQVALPCTERNLTEAKTTMTLGRGFMPVVSMKGRDEVRLASFQSLAGATVLGFWAGVAPPVKAAAATAADDSDGDQDTDQDTQDDLGLDDLDLDGLDFDADADADDDADDDGGDSDLDDLLAGFDLDSDDDEDSDSDDDDEMDPELAALLADL